MKNNIIYSLMQVFPQRGIGLWADAIFDRISEYFPRELTHASDILRAVEGILEAFDGERMGDIRARHFYGIPLQYDVRDSQSKEFSIARGLAWRVKAFVHHGRAKFEDWEISQDANMPSWTWASRKSARQLHEKDVRLEFDGSQGEKAPGVRYRITNRDGKVISLRQFAISPLPGHYLKFFPWIDVISWVIHGRLTIDPADPGKILVFAGVDKADLHLDDNHVTAGDQTTAFFLSFVERYDVEDLDWSWQALFLFVRRVTPGRFCRIGLWIPKLQFETNMSLKVRKAIKRILKSGGSDHGATVERRTLRLV